MAKNFEELVWLIFCCAAPTAMDCTPVLASNLEQSARIEKEVPYSGFATRPAAELRSPFTAHLQALLESSNCRRSRIGANTETNVSGGLHELG